MTRDAFIWKSILAIDESHFGPHTGPLYTAWTVRPSTRKPGWWDLFLGEAETFHGTYLTEAAAKRRGTQITKGA